MQKPKRKRRPKLQPAKAKRNVRIGDRDIAILKDLASYHFLTAEQIRRLHFPAGSQSYCNERLRAMFHKPYRYLDRHPLPMEWGKGSPKLAYSLSKQGAEKLQGEGLPVFVTHQSAHKQKQATAVYKRHEVAINEFRISAELAAEKQGWKIGKWVTEAEFKNPTLLSQMRVYDPKSGTRIPVVPDGFFSLYFPKQDMWSIFFLELDRGTMEIPRYRRKKIRGYHIFDEKWRQLDIFRKYKDLQITFRVLNVVDGGIKRAVNLKEKAAEAEFMQEREEDRLLKSWRFYFTTLTDITEEGIFTEPIWLIPYRSRTEKERYALIDFDRDF